jgi:hypothetical protein
MKHTPGPWQVGHFDSNMICDSDGANRGCSPIARVEGTAAKRRANARLIACAPELLEALKLALSAHGVMLLSDPPQEAWKAYGVEQKALAVIAKAEGA